MFNAIINFFTGLVVSVTTFFGGTVTTTDTLIMRAVLEPGVAPKVTLIQSLKDSKKSFVTLSSDGKATVSAPPGAEFAKVYAWGGAGGSFGNDGGPFAITHVLGFNPQNMPGGHGGYVSGKVPVTESKQFSITLGTAGPSGYYKGDNNDWIGGPGKATRVSFDGKEIMVAGAGSNLSARTFVWGADGFGGWEAYNYDWPNGGHTQLNPVEKYVEELRAYFANGGSPAAGVIKSGGAFHPDFDKFNGDPKKAFPNTTSLFGSVGGDGKTVGSWVYKALHPSNMYVYTIGLTGGTSYIDSSSVSEPVYYSGDPEKNSSDNGLWKEFLFKSSNQFGSIGVARAACCRGAGNGAVIVEFYNSTTTKSVVTVPEEVPYLNLSAELDGTNINGSTSVPKNSAPNLRWAFAHIDTMDSCSLIKTSTGGTAFNSLSGSVLLNQSSATTNTLTPGSYTYTLRCDDLTLSSSVSFTVLDTTLCANGATNYPECTLSCSNGATNPPLCTVENEGGDTGTGIIPGDVTGGNGSVVLTLPESGTVNIKYLGGKNGKSDKKTISLGVFPKNSISSPELVIVSLPSIPKDVDFACALNGGGFASCAGARVAMSPDGFGGYRADIEVSSSEKIAGENLSIVVRAVSGSLSSNNMSLKILQDAKNPNFTEF